MEIKIEKKHGKYKVVVFNDKWPHGYVIGARKSKRAAKILAESIRMADKLGNTK